MADRARYVIINDIDAPEPNMVCQWVPGIGYCYLDRRNGKPRHDGMRGAEATPIEAFGFEWAEDRDGMVRFYQAERPVTATYRDGEPRRWQSRTTFFEYRRIKAAAVPETVQETPDD